jgi:LPXTG-motif cell wall-anchored protein
VPVVETTTTQAETQAEAPVAVLAAQASRADQIGVAAAHQGALPSTGRNPWPVAVFASMAISAGLALIFVARRSVKLPVGR